MYKTLISPSQLADHLDDPAYVVVDVRHDLAQPADWGAAQYAAGHVPGARFAHLDRDLSAPKTGRNGRHPLPPPEVAAATFGRLGIGTHMQVVAYDQGAGMYASRLWWMLRWLGHEHVAVLDGGMARWQAAGLPVTTELPAVHPVRFAIGTTLSTVGVQDVLDTLATRARFIIDARLPERFRGEVEPIDPVAGHIPGAHNRPYTQNLTPEGSFKSRETLAAEFGALLGATPASAVIHQCGSGVTACHNVLAMAVAGYGDTTLYPGSWSEWVSDKGRPVATGP
jgi:thiosulfate/3-mercaptopyruvate sulfurtransferase